MQSDRPLATQRHRKTGRLALAACLAVSLVSAESRADSTEAPPQEAEIAIAESAAKKTAGIVLTVIGSAVLVGGLMTTLGAAVCKECSSTPGLVGKVLIGSSAPFFILGVPLWVNNANGPYPRTDFNAATVSPLNLGFGYRMSF